MLETTTFLYKMLIFISFFFIIKFKETRNTCKFVTALPISKDISSNSAAIKHQTDSLPISQRKLVMVNILHSEIPLFHG